MKNLTPHAITLSRADGTTVTFPPSGIIARVTSTDEVAQYYKKQFRTEDAEEFYILVELPNGCKFKIYKTDRLIDVYEIFENQGHTELFAPTVLKFVEERKNYERA